MRSQHTQEWPISASATRLSMTMAQNETRRCPFCAEDIKLEAQRCPYCRRRVRGRLEFMRRPLFARRASIRPWAARRRCPFCAEEIRTEARSCPHCRRRLGRISEFMQGSFFVVAPHLFLLVFVAAFWLFFSHKASRFLSSERIDFVRSPDAIAIQSPRMHLSPDRNTIYVEGTIANRGGTAWRGIAIKVDFFDARQELVDTAGATLRKELGPGETAPFKVEQPHPQDLSRYVRCEAYVARAVEASGRP